MHLHRGFTLIQLLVAMTVASVLYLVALPSFTHLYQSHKATSEINSFKSHLQLARGLALAHGQYVSVCALGSNSSCGDDWSRGLLIFKDSDFDGELEQESDILRLLPRPNDSATISFNAFGPSYINYNPQGNSLTKNNNGNIVYCHQSGSTDHARVIIFYVSGRAYFGQDSNNNGIPENGSEIDVEC